MVQEQTAKIDCIGGDVTTVDTKVSALDDLRPAISKLAIWRPRVEQVMGTLQAEPGDLREQIAHLSSTSVEPTLSPCASDLRAKGGDTSHGQSGHHINLHPRGSMMGPPPILTPAMGMFVLSTLEYSLSYRKSSSTFMDCPRFDGDNPMEWCLKCESYF